MLPAFEENKNKADSLTPHQKGLLAQELTVKRWRHVRDYKINDLIKDSEEAWDHLLKNRPDAKDTNLNLSLKDRAVLENQKSKGLRLGKIPEVVFSLLAIQHNATFPSDDRFFRGQAMNREAKDNQELYESFLSVNFGEANIDLQFWLFRLNMIMDGTACAAIHYRTQERERVVYENKSVLGINFGTETKKKKVVEWEGTIVEPLSFHDWVVDPDARCIDDAYLIRRWYENPRKVERDYGLEPNSVKTHDAVHNNAADVPDNDEDNIREYLGVEILERSMTEEAGQRQALLMVQYDDFIIDGKLYPNHCAVILNDIDVIWFGENDYNHGKKPYLIGQYYPMPNSMYGLSAIKHSIPKAAAIDQFVHSRLAASHKAANPIILTNTNEEIFKDSINVDYGATLPVKNPSNAIRIEQLPLQSGQDTQFIIENLEQRIENETGATPVFSGENPDGTDVTAFQVDQHVQAGSIKQQINAVKTFNNMVLEPFLRMVHENFQQFLKEPKPVPGSDELIERDNLRLMDFKWSLVGMSAANNLNLQMQQSIRLLTEMIPVGQQHGWLQLKQGVSVIDPHQIFKKLLMQAKFDDVDDIVELIEPDEQSGQGIPPGAVDPSGLPMAPGQPPAIPVGGQLPPGAGPADPGVNAGIPAGAVGQPV